jgi:TonB family protein
MRRLAVLSVIGFLLVPASVFAQETSAPSAHSPRYLKVCSDKIPPPCATAPTRTYSPDPQYSKEARQAKIEGTVVLGAIVGVDGHPHDIHVVRYLGHGLDEQAIESLKQWTFEPGTSEGGPVPVLVNVQMNFRLHP